MALPASAPAHVLSTYAAVPMVSSALPYVIPYLAAALVALGVLRVTWRRGEHAGVRAFSIGMACVVLWSVGNALEVLSPGLGGKLFWVQVEYVGKAIIPVAWFFTALHYSGRAEWATPRVVAALSLVPLTTIVLAWTNHLHGWLRYDVRLDTAGPFPIVAKEYGNWFWIHLGYSYLLILAATLLILDTLLRSRATYRGQAAAWLVAALAPAVPNLLYVFGLSPFPRLDLTPAGFALSGLAIAWGNRRFGILDVVPAAREKLLEAMRDGVLVCDAHHRLVDLNGAAEEMLATRARDAIGGEMRELLPAWKPGTGMPEVVSETEMDGPDGGRVYETRTTPLHCSNGSARGFLTVLRDITEARRLRDALTTLSVRDELTGLLNRRGFTVLAEQQLKLAVRKRRPLVVLFGDLDVLKEINDTHGRAAGDLALAAAARALQATLRETDVVSRFSGDEFVALLPETPDSEAERVMERITAALRHCVRSEGLPFTLSLSMGVESFDPAVEDGVALEELLHRADRAMYRRKRAARSA